MGVLRLIFDEYTVKLVNNLHEHCQLWQEKNKTEMKGWVWGHRGTSKGHHC